MRAVLIAAFLVATIIGISTAESDETVPEENRLDVELVQQPSKSPLTLEEAKMHISAGESGQVVEQAEDLAAAFKNATSAYEDHSMTPGQVWAVLSKTEVSKLILHSPYSRYSTCTCGTSCYRLPMGSRAICKMIQWKIDTGFACHYKFFGHPVSSSVCFHPLTEKAAKEKEKKAAEKDAKAKEKAKKAAEKVAKKKEKEKKVAEVAAKKVEKASKKVAAELSAKAKEAKDKKEKAEKVVEKAKKKKEKDHKKEKQAKAKKEIAKKAIVQAKKEKKTKKKMEKQKKKAEEKGEKKLAEQKKKAAKQLAKNKKKCEAKGLPHCDTVKCSPLGEACDQPGYTYNKGVCKKPGYYSHAVEWTATIYAWINCCPWCTKQYGAGYQCVGRKYFDIGHSASSCRCMNTAYHAPKSYVPDTTKVEARCKKCASGYRLENGKCVFIPVCRVDSRETQKIFFGVNPCPWCTKDFGAGWGCVGSRDLGWAVHRGICNKRFCKYSANGGYELAQAEEFASAGTDEEVVEEA